MQSKCLSIQRLRTSVFFASVRGLYYRRRLCIKACIVVEYNFPSDSEKRLPDYLSGLFLGL